MFLRTIRPPAQPPSSRYNGSFVKRNEGHYKPPDTWLGSRPARLRPARQACARSARSPGARSDYLLEDQGDLIATLCDKREADSSHRRSEEPRRTLRTPQASQ